MSAERALVVVTPYESRRLIAKAVAKHPDVLRAMRDGWIIVATGSTTAYVVEELTGEALLKENFISGHITLGETWGTPKNPDYIFPVVLHRGRRMDMRPEEALKEFSAGDVFVKGANAVDPAFHAGVFMGNSAGGTIGSAIGTLHSRGAKLLVPVGLEKLVSSVPEAARHTGIMSFQRHMGMRVGMMPLVNATVITEVQALSALFGLAAYHIGSGGIAGSEGAVVLALEGEASAVEAAFRWVQSIKGEPPLQRPNGLPQQE